MDANADTILVTLFLLGMALLGLAMLAVSLRVGPRRGTWNQPAAKLRRPGRAMWISLLVVAALHVVAGVVCLVAVPGAGVGVLLVLIATAAFYCLCAGSFGIATRLARVRH